MFFHKPPVSRQPCSQVTRKSGTEQQMYFPSLLAGKSAVGQEQRDEVWLRAGRAPSRWGGACTDPAWLRHKWRGNNEKNDSSGIPGPLVFQTASHYAALQPSPLRHVSGKYRSYMCTAYGQVGPDSPLEDLGKHDICEGRIWKVS